MKLHTLIACAALTLLTPAAHGTVVYDWQGTCSAGCSGTAHATLYLDDRYTPGNAVMPFDGTVSTTVLGLRWHMPSDGNREESEGSLEGPRHRVFGTVVNPLALPEQSGAGSGTLFAYGGYMETFFTSFRDGNWQFGTGFSQSSVCNETLPAGGCRGTSGVWVLRAVPEPATQSLLGLGLVAIAGLRRRARRV